MNVSKSDSPGKFFALFDYAIIIFLFLTIVPFLVLSFYAHPSWDDFMYAYYSDVKGFWEAQKIWYMTWSGRFFSTAFLSFANPLVFRSITGYKIMTFLLILATFAVIYYAVSAFFRDSVKTRSKILASLSLCYLYLSGLPSVSLALYWHSSVVIYQVANIAMLLIFVLLLKMYSDDGIKSKINIFIVCILIFVVSGSNEISMLSIVVLFLMLFISNIIIFKKIDGLLLLFAGVSVISFLIVYMAPGNSVRLQVHPDSHKLFFTLKSSFTDLISFIKYRLFNIPLLLFTILFIPFCSKAMTDVNFKYKKLLQYPLLTVTIGLLILYSGFVVSYWSLGTTPPARALNVSFFTFLLIWFYATASIIYYFKERKDKTIPGLPGYAYVIICLFIFIGFIKETGNIKTAVKDLSGPAQKFDSELNKRYSMISADNSDTCKVDSLEVIPGSFFYSDITADPDEYFNRYQANYFHKKFMIRNSSKINNDTIQ